MKVIYNILVLFILTSNNNSFAQKNSQLELGSIIPMSKELMINVNNEKMSLNNNFNENGINFRCNTFFCNMWKML